METEAGGEAARERFDSGLSSGPNPTSMRRYGLHPKLGPAAGGGNDFRTVMIPGLSVEAIS